MSDRFPNIDWYCDRCNSYLNSQDGFIVVQLSRHKFNIFIMNRYM